jgi:methylated-DNA-[protein]-cysteine S-methyltransferase
MTEIRTATLHHPHGPITVAATTRGIVRIAFASEDPERVEGELAALGNLREDPAALADELAWLAEVLDGRARAPAPATDLRLARTPFALDVLDAIAAVPPGSTLSYAGLAAAAGRPRAVRAAAHVCATNPIPLVIGCHRIVRSDGTIGDYRGGADLKARLITGEAAAAPA